MSSPRTAWHPMFAAFIMERKPKSVRLETDVTLSLEPLRADILLIRKSDAFIDDATAFYGLWLRMGPIAILEYKSRRHSARPGVWDQLYTYAHQYRRSHLDEVQHPCNLSVFLFVHDVTPTVSREAQQYDLEINDSKSAYLAVTGGLFPTWIVSLDRLAQEEQKPLIGAFGSLRVAADDLDSQRWLGEFVLKNREQLLNLKDYEELRRDFIDTPEFQEWVKLSPYAQDQVGQARRQGEAKGAAAVLLDLLGVRFGTISADTKARVQAADSERIRYWSKRVLTAASIDDVFAENS